MARRFNRYLSALALLAFSLVLCRVNARNDNILHTKVTDDETPADSSGGRGSSQEAGLYLSLKHRDAPNSPFLQPRYKNRHELLQIVLKRDEARAEEFRYHIAQRRPRQATGMVKEEYPVAMADSPPNPTGEDGAWLWPPAGAGEYYTEFNVGTPRQLQVAMVDLASDTVWLGKPPTTIADEPLKNAHLFDPSSSSSFTPITSSSKACAAVAGVHEHGQACQVRVGTGPSFVLEVAYDDVRLNRTAEHTSSSVMRDILLGVSQVELPTGGVLGLGRGRTSFATQMLTRTRPTFAYCLADTDEPSGSSLVFGDIRDSHRLEFTPLVAYPHVATLYMVNLVGIVVNGVRLPIPKGVLELSSDGTQGGAIVDMSTRFTRLPRRAFHQVMHAMKARIRLPTTDVPGFHLCYNPEQLRRVPTLTLLFEGGASMALPTENLFVPATERGDVMCLAMVPGRSGTATVIGSTQQQNFLMLVDRLRARLGFGPRQCTTFPTTS